MSKTPIESTKNTERLVRVQRTPIYNKEAISGRKTLIARKKYAIGVKTLIARAEDQVICAQKTQKKLATQIKSYIQHSKNN